MILAALATPAEAQDNQPALDLLRRTRFRWKLRPRQVTGDAKHGTVANIVAIEREHVRASIPLSAVGHRPGLFADTDVVDDQAADADHCSGKEMLRFISQDERTHRRIVEAPFDACAIRMLRAQCMTSRRGRRVGRRLDEMFLERVRDDHETEAYAKAMRKHRTWIEPLFAEAAERRNPRRFRLRGAEKVTIQAQMIAAGQHLKRLVSKHGWGRRP